MQTQRNGLNVKEHKIFAQTIALYKKYTIFAELLRFIIPLMNGCGQENSTSLSALFF